MEDIDSDLFQEWLRDIYNKEGFNSAKASFKNCISQYHSTLFIDDYSANTAEANNYIRAKSKFEINRITEVLPTQDNKYDYLGCRIDDCKQRMEKAKNSFIEFCGSVLALGISRYMTEYIIAEDIMSVLQTMLSEIRTKQNRQEKAIRHIIDILNDTDTNEKDKLNSILEYIRNLLTERGNTVGGIEFLDYVCNNLWGFGGDDCKESDITLSLFIRGSWLLDKDKDGNLYDRLYDLKEELEKQTTDTRTNTEPTASIEQTTDRANKVKLPIELDNDIVRKNFENALSRGFMERNGDGYKWTFGGNRGQARLGYFCNRIFQSPRPINCLEKLFGVQRLSSSITQADYASKAASVIAWKKNIDDIIFKD